MHLLSHLGCLVVPAILLSYGMISVLSVFVPIMGRSGTKTNPEVFIGGITCLATVFCYLVLVSSRKIDNSVEKGVSVTVLHLCKFVLFCRTHCYA